MNRALLSASKRDTDNTEWGTPRAFYGWLDGLFHFTVDVCASFRNAKHPRYWNKADNGLRQSWEGETAWCNPPYGREIGLWGTKARKEAIFANSMSVQLVPARPDTEWWALNALNVDGKAGALVRSYFVPSTRMWWLRWEGLITGIYFHDQRLKFEGAKDVAPFPSALIIHASPGRRVPTPSPHAWPDILRGWPK